MTEPGPGPAQAGTDSAQALRRRGPVLAASRPGSAPGRRRARTPRAARSSIDLGRREHRQDRDAGPRGEGRDGLGAVGRRLLPVEQDHQRHAGALRRDLGQQGRPPRPSCRPSSGRRRPSRSGRPRPAAAPAAAWRPMAAAGLGAVGLRLLAIRQVRLLDAPARRAPSRWRRPGGCPCRPARTRRRSRPPRPVEQRGRVGPPHRARRAPVSICPALRKRGEIRPLFRRNSPIRSASASRRKSTNARW